jgi:uncharacterized damage-inducible protein DinB
MVHPLVAQLYFTRKEWLRGLEGVSSEDAVKHLGPMNCISWLVGHIAWHEQHYWLDLAQGRLPVPELQDQFSYGKPKSTPSYDFVLRKYLEVTRMTCPYLDKLTSADLQEELLRKGKVVGQNLGTAMLRLIYHYWYHSGEIQAIRQLLGHHGLPEFIGEIEKLAPYRSEYGD